MKTLLFTLFSFFAIVGFSQQKNSAQLLENYGHVYSDNSPFRKKVLEVIEKDGFAKVQLISDPLNEEALMYSRYFVPLVWEFPEQCSFEVLPAVFLDDSVFLKKEIEAERLFFLKQKHPKKYLNYLFRRLEFSEENKMSERKYDFVFNPSAAWAETGFAEKIESFNEIERNAFEEEKKKAIKRIKEEHKRILENKDLQDEIFNEFYSAVDPFLNLTFYFSQKKYGPVITPKQIDSLKNEQRKLFFENYDKSVVLFLINDEKVEFDLLRILFGNGIFASHYRRPMTSEKLNLKDSLRRKELEKEWNNCPAIRQQSSWVFPKDQGFWLSFVPKNRIGTKFKYQLKVTLYGKEIYNKKHKSEGYFIDEKLSFRFPNPGEEICFDAVILEPKLDSCASVRKCFKFECPKIEIAKGEERRAFGDNYIKVSNSEFAKVIVKGKGYDQYNHLLEEMTQTFSKTGQKKITGHYENFWENRSWKKKYVTRACLSFEVFNKITNERLDFCPVPADTCLNDKPDYIDFYEYSEVIYPDKIPEGRPVFKDFKINYNIRKGVSQSGENSLIVFFDIKDLNTKPPFKAYTVYPRGEIDDYEKWLTSQKCKTPRCIDRDYRSVFKTKSETREFLIILSEPESIKSKGNHYTFQIEIEDGEGKMKSLIFEKEFSFGKKQRKRQLKIIKKLEKNHRPTVIRASDCDKNDGLILGMHVNEIDYTWNTGDTIGNLINLKPGKYTINYHVANEPVEKTITVPTWKSNIERTVQWNPAEDSCKGEIIFKLKKEFLPYQFSLEEKRNVWNDTLVNDTIFKLSNLCKGFYDFRVDNPESCPEEFSVYIADCRKIQNSIAHIKNTSSPTSEDGLIRLVFPRFGISDSKIEWDNGKEGFLNYGLKIGRHKLRISNEYGCGREFEFDVKSD